MLVREQAALRRVATLVTREAPPGEVFGGQQDNFVGQGRFLRGSSVKFRVYRVANP